MDIVLKSELPTLEEYKYLRSSVGWKLVDDNSIIKGLDSSTYSILAKQEIILLVWGALSVMGVFFR